MPHSGLLFEGNGTHQIVNMSLYTQQNSSSVYLYVPPTSVFITVISFYIYSFSKVGRLQRHVHLVNHPPRNWLCNTLNILTHTHTSGTWRHQLCNFYADVARLRKTSSFIHGTIYNSLIYEPEPWLCLTVTKLLRSTLAGHDCAFRSKRLLGIDGASQTENRLSHTRRSGRLFGIMWLTL